MVLSAQGNDDIQFASAIGINEASTEESTDANIGASTVVGTQCLEEEGLDISENSQLYNDVLCLGQLPKDEFSDYAVYSNLIVIEP